MTRLDRYLDEVCRGVGGPRALRQHLRRELREHLLDAAAEYAASGLTEEQALDRALRDFGAAAEVRGELEATHGHRAMAVVIDKALQWKERTMKTGWFWVTIVHAALAGVMAIEVAFVWVVMIFILPRFRQMQEDGWIDALGPDAEPVASWGAGFLNHVAWACANHWWFWVPLLTAWAAFEWRVRSEHKTHVRLAAMGTLALGLMLVVALTAAALVLPMTVAMPAMYARHPEPAVRDAVTGIDAAVSGLREAAARQDWEAMSDHARDASRRLTDLSHMGAAAPALAASGDQPRVDLIRSQIRSARLSMRAAQQATWDRDAARLRAELEAFDEAYAPLRRPGTTQPSR